MQKKKKKRFFSETRLQRPSSLKPCKAFPLTTVCDNGSYWLLLREKSFFLSCVLLLKYDTASYNGQPMAPNRIWLMLFRGVCSQVSTFDCIPWKWCSWCIEVLSYRQHIRCPMGMYPVLGSDPPLDFRTAFLQFFFKLLGFCLALFLHSGEDLDALNPKIIPPCTIESGSQTRQGNTSFFLTTSFEFHHQVQQETPSPSILSFPFSHLYVLCPISLMFLSFNRQLLDITTIHHMLWYVCTSSCLRTVWDAYNALCGMVMELEMLLFWPKGNFNSIMETHHRSVQSNPEFCERKLVVTYQDLNYE